MFDLRRESERPLAESLARLGESLARRPQTPS